MQSLLVWLQTNYAPALQCLAGIVVVLELGVRLLIPTSSADGALQRFGGVLTSIMSFLRVPILIKTDIGVALVSPNSTQAVDNLNKPTT